MCYIYMYLYVYYNSIITTTCVTHAHTMLTVFTVNLFSDSMNSPHNVTTTVGQPVVLSCASSYTSVPTPTFNWRVVSPFPRAIAGSDNAVVGLNGSLYVLKPTADQSLIVFECSLQNGNNVRTGYIRLIVEGE